MADLKELIHGERKSRINWGFKWALLCALTWGLGFMIEELIWKVEPYSGTFGLDGTEGYMLTAVLISTFFAIFITIVMALCWTGVQGKLGEFKKVLGNKKNLKYLIVSALCGGQMAVLGCTLATGYIGAAFSSGMCLLSAIAGAFFARVINKERMSKKTILGILIMLVGGIFILDPGQMIDNIQNPESPDGIALGYIGALMAIFGWGLEGNIVIKVLDINDSDVTMPVRYVVEAVIWILVMLPIMGAWLGFDVVWNAFIDCWSSVDNIIWMILIGFTLGLCYATQYKAFPLIGVGRTLSIDSFYVPIALVCLWIFLGDNIGLMVVGGVVIALIGIFVMYWDSGSLEESNRDVGGGQ